MKETIKDVTGDKELVQYINLLQKHHFDKTGVAIDQSDLVRILIRDKVRVLLDVGAIVIQKEKVIANT